MNDTTRKGGGERGRGVRYEVERPEGVSVAEWGLERVRLRSTSIRSYLGCPLLIEEVLDSNYAILHAPMLAKDHVEPPPGTARRARRVR